MATVLYSNHGKGGSDGDFATNLLLAGGGDNALTIHGAAGWQFSEDDRSPDGPTDGHGFRRTSDGSSASLLGEWTPTGPRNGARAWVYIPGGVTSHWCILRLLNASGQLVANLFLRDNGAFRAYEGSSSISASQSPVVTGDTGWYCLTLLADHAAQRLEYRVQDATGADVHTWDSGPGGVTLSSEVAGFRVGDVVAGSYGVSEFRIGSRISWGSIDSGWIPGNVNPYHPPPEPPPPTTPVSHYNTAEGVEIGASAPTGTGEAPEGILFSARGGTGGSVRATDQAIFGDRAYRVLAGPDSSAFVQWGFSSMRPAFRAYLNIPATPSHTTQIMLFRNLVEDPIARVALNEHSQVLLQSQTHGTADTATLPGVVDFGRGPIRIELRADISADLVEAAWGYWDGGREGVAQITTRDLEGTPVSLAAVGKMHSTLWDADFLLDELALNVRSTEHIGGQTSEYDLITTAGPDVTGVEPGQAFALSGTGDATWEQVAHPGHPVVPVTQDGTAATGIAPYTVDGVSLEFDYGGAIQTVVVLPATDCYITGPGGQLQAAQLVIIVPTEGPPEGPTPPADPEDGDLWVDSTTGVLHRWTAPLGTGARTNFLANPSFEDGTTGYYGGSTTITSTTATNAAIRAGQQALAIDVQGAGASNGYGGTATDLPPGSAGRWVGWSVVARRSSGVESARMWVDSPDVSGSAVYLHGWDLTTAPQAEQERQTVAWQIPAGATRIRTWLRLSASPSGGPPSDGSVHTDAWMLTIADTEAEALAAAASPYMDGDTAPPLTAWDGTPHASPSTYTPQWVPIG